MIVVKDHKIILDGAAVPFLSSRNHGGKVKPTAIVLHDTASPLKPDGDIAWLRGGPGQSQNASAHVVIDRAGKITQLIDLNILGWHAGISKWNGKSGCNSFTIGFEIDNPGKLAKVGDTVYRGVGTYDTRKPPEYGPGPLRVAYAETPQHGKGYWLDYTDEQIEAVIELCRASVEAYPSIKEIITHWLVSPGRKIDTNPLFPLQQVRDRVLGNMTQKKPTEAEVKKAVEAAKSFDPDATVMVDKLNLRSLPQMGDNVVGSIPVGTRVDVQEASGDWLRIKTPAGASGYVYAKMLKLD